MGLLWCCVGSNRWVLIRKVEGGECLSGYGFHVGQMGTCTNGQL